MIDPIQNLSKIGLDRNVNDLGLYISPPIWFLASQAYFILSFLDMPVYPITSQI